jgi:hypothetical protein
MQSIPAIRAAKKFCHKNLLNDIISQASGGEGNAANTFKGQESGKIYSETWG